MWIVEISHLFNQKRKNEYTFNPSILHLHDNLFLVSYRVILYDLPFPIHPWGAWSYKVFKNPVLASQAKYRLWLGSKLTHSLPQKTFAQKVNDGENDTTSLALIELKSDGSFQLVWNIGQLFPGEYNQDARLVKTTSSNPDQKEDDISIVYNVFSREGVSLRVRDLKLTSNKVELSEERYLFAHVYRNSEKHCIYEQTKSIIMYALDDSFCRIVDGDMTKKEFKGFDLLYQKYGKKNILLSLSTPSVTYQNNKRLACGHAKILYKNLKRFDFLEGLDTKLIKPHGKYIYFAFFFEFEGDEISRISPLFIPSINNSHLPYLLFMPIGLTTYKDKFILSAGEGDIRCNLIMLRQDEIETCLNGEMGSYFLTEQMSINHVGYFGNHLNCGDSAFEIIFRSLYHNTPHVISFSKEFKQKDSIISLQVLGGGDVINNYFIPDQIPKNSIAISVGIPYSEYIPLLNKFAQVYLRNERDAQLLKKPFVPDITFLLRYLWSADMSKIIRKPKQIGIILTRTYYHPDYSNVYEAFIDEFVLFSELLHKNGFTIVFIPFCINRLNHLENDNLIIQDIVKKLSFEPIIFKVQEEENYVHEIYLKIAENGFNICTRFHSHIFSILHHVPFISLTCGRKSIELMHNNLPECLYKLKTNDIDLPIEFDGSLFFHFFQQKYSERKSIEAKVINWCDKYMKLMETFMISYLPMLRKYAENVQTILWRQNTPPYDVSSPQEWRMDHPLHQQQSYIPKLVSHCMPKITSENKQENDELDQKHVDSLDNQKENEKSTPKIDVPIPNTNPLSFPQSVGYSPMIVNPGLVHQVYTPRYVYSVIPQQTQSQPVLPKTYHVVPTLNYFSPSQQPFVENMREQPVYQPYFPQSTSVPPSCVQTPPSNITQYVVQTPSTPQYLLQNSSVPSFVQNPTQHVFSQFPIPYSFQQCNPVQQVMPQSPIQYVPTFQPQPIIHPFAFEPSPSTSHIMSQPFVQAMPPSFVQENPIRYYSPFPNQAPHTNVYNQQQQIFSSPQTYHGPLPNLQSQPNNITPDSKPNANSIEQPINLLSDNNQPGKSISSSPNYLG